MQRPIASDPEPTRSDVVLITGGASGIGAATAVLFAERGAKVWIADVAIDKARAVATQICCKAIGLDVTKKQDWTAAADEIARRDGHLDVLVNAAGINRTAADTDLFSVDLESWREIFSVNLEGTLLGCQTAIQAMEKSGGAIVNVSSTTAHSPTPTLAAYGASKAAVHQLSKTVAAACAQRRLSIRCNAVLPGLAETPLTAWMPAEFRSKWEAEIPAGRFGAPEEIAQAIVFLASRDASYINGHGLVVDGGLLSRPVVR